MKKIISILLFSVFILCGCGEANNIPKNVMPIQRRKDVYKDQIKFYGFDWLTEAKTILDKFNADFGEDTYTIEIAEKSIENTPLCRYYYYIKGKNDKALLWNIAENEVTGVSLTFISNDNGEHCYLISGSFDFSNSEETINEIRNKLKTKYTYDSQSDMYRDSNGNVILPILGSFSYSCGEAIDMINEIERNSIVKPTKDVGDTNGL